MRITTHQLIQLRNMALDNGNNKYHSIQLENKTSMTVITPSENRS